MLQAAQRMGIHSVWFFPKDESKLNAFVIISGNVFHYQDFNK